MYLGNWLTDSKRIFSDEWIESTCTLLPKSPISKERYLGVDIAGMGEDESTFEGLARQGESVHQFHHQTTTKTRTTETIQLILDIESQYNFDKIGVDDGGMGVGVFDQLLKDDRTRYKVIGLNNARRVIDKDEKQKKLLKEEMYYNLLAMGERGEIKLLNNDEVKASLRTIMIEENGKISGRYSHIAEGIIRAAYLAKEKSLNPWILSLKV